MNPNDSPERFGGFWKALNEQVRKHEETIEALRLAEQKYRGIFENALEGMFQTSPDGKYLCANPALARMYGYESPVDLVEALTDISRQLYVDPNRRAEFQRLLHENDTVSEFESQIFQRDGGVIWISEHARAVRDECSGDLLHYEGIVQDITRRKRAEEAREQAEARKAAQYAVTRALAESSHLHEAAGEIMRALCESIGWDFGDLWRVEPATGVVRCVDLWHRPELKVEEFVEMTRQISFAKGRGLPGRVWSSKRAFWVPDVVNDPNFPRAAVAQRCGLHGGFAFPILLGSEVIGVLEFFADTMHAPDDDLLAMLAAIGRQIGQFIEREQIAEQLARYTEELRAKNAHLEADLDMAREIQQVFLTQNYPSFPRGIESGQSWLRFCHCYLPAQRVGGDFFCVLPLSDTEAGVFICDIVGHGLRAALVTAIVRGLVEELTPIARDVGRFLTEINRGLLAIFRQTDMPMMASAFYLVVNIADGRMTYANAGHPRPFHVQRQAGIAEPFPNGESHGPVLGIFPHAEYRGGVCAVAPGDLIVLFTDGVYEVKIASDDYYGEQRLLGAVRDRMLQPAAELFGEVLSEIQETCLTRQFADDVCLVGIEIVQTGETGTNVRVA